MDAWNIIGSSSMPDGDTCKANEEEDDGTLLLLCLDVDAVFIDEEIDDVLTTLRRRRRTFDGISFNISGLDVLIRC